MCYIDIMLSVNTLVIKVLHVLTHLSSYNAFFGWSAIYDKRLYYMSKLCCSGGEIFIQAISELHFELHIPNNHYCGSGTKLVK